MSTDRKGRLDAFIGLSPSEIGLAHHDELIQLESPFLRHLISIAPTRDSLRRGARDGEFGDFRYTIRNPERLGSHNHVIIADIRNGSGEFMPLVLKQGDAIAQAQDYVKQVHDYPLLAEYMATPYGVVDNWVVLEYVSGLSYAGIADRMQRDPQFVTRYATDMYHLFDRTAFAGLAIDDVNFQDGHNIFYNEAARSITFMEHKNLHPALEGKTPQEILFIQLDREIMHAMPRQGEDNDVKAGSMQFAFQLLQHAFAAHDSREYYVRATFITPMHPDFRKVYESQFLWDRDHQPLTDQQFAQLINHPFMADGRPILLPTTSHSPYIGGTWRSNFQAHGFRPDCIEAVQQGDFDRFSQLVLDRAYIVPLEASDPRAVPHIVGL